MAPHTGNRSMPIPMRGLLIEAALITAAAVAVSLPAVYLGLDMALAHAVHLPEHTELRAYGNRTADLAFAAAIIAIAWLAIPAVRRRYPLASRCAAVYVGTLLIASMGIITNLKIARDRPRPNEVIQFGGQFEYKPPFGDEACPCKSFPSSAAGFAYLFSSPYFVLRRRRPQAARAFLFGGLLWGSLVGLLRMAANMHWLTDIVWAAAFVLVTASALSRVSVTWYRDESPPNGVAG